MKANELMIGDWVQIRHGRKLKLELDQFYAQGCHEFREHPIDYFSTFDPIPLTEGILKENGFEKHELHSWILKKQWQWSVTVHLHETGSVISIDKEIEGHKGVDSCHICYKGYVHELQHALRLCGLDELADNFKIE